MDIKHLYFFYEQLKFSMKQTFNNKFFFWVHSTLILEKLYRKVSLFLLGKRSDLIFFLK